MNKSNLVIMKTHIINKGVINEFNKMQASGYDCVLLIDNQKNLIQDQRTPWQIEKFYGQNIKCILMNSEKLKALNLPFYAFKSTNASYIDVLWFNCDYTVYFVVSLLPDYDFYWQLEYDVYYNDENYCSFFAKFENDQTDFLTTHYGKSSQEWVWDDVDWAYKAEERWKSFFPVTRFAKKYADALYQTRLEKGEIYSSLKDILWLECEIFCPSEAHLMGFSVKNIPEHKITLNDHLDLNEDRIFQKKDCLLYHPLKGNYEQRIAQYEQKVTELQQNTNGITTAEYKNQKKINTYSFFQVFPFLRIIHEENTKKFMLWRFIPVRKIVYYSKSVDKYLFNIKYKTVKSN